MNEYFHLVLSQAIPRRAVGVLSSVRRRGVQEEAAPESDSTVKYLTELQLAQVSAGCRAHTSTQLSFAFHGQMDCSICLRSWKEGRVGLPSYESRCVILHFPTDVHCSTTHE